jgi:hypothetical protein
MDMNVCPQTEAEFVLYFYSLIGRRLGTNADDWKAVLSDSYLWKGTKIPLPKNLPGPGEKHPPDAPFFGLSVQESASGVAPRIWIPAAEPDIDVNNNKWYRRYIQVIRDGDLSFEWTWTYQSGHDYVPLLKGVQVPGGGENPNPPNNSDFITKDECQRMINEAVANCLKFEDKIALQAHDASIVCVDGDKGNYLIANRGVINAWETLIVKKP